MSAGENPITEEGFNVVQKELDQLIKLDREAIKKAIGEARELGDLKENAEYHAAKEKQALIEGRISHLQSIVATSKVVKVSEVQSDKIVFGATVNLINADTEEEVTYQIVGQDESDTSKGRVSFSSPLGKAMIGKEEGDTIIVKAPKGDIEYEVESFEFK